MLDQVIAEYMAKHPRSRAGRRLHYKVMLALHTGLRWGEVHGLGWDDLSLDTVPPVLRPQRSYQGSLKTESSAEPIPLGAEVAALLRRWKAEQERDQGDKKCKWVFPNVKGELMARQPDLETKLIKEAGRRAGLTDKITPHVFRHTFGTWVYEHTTDIKRTQRLLRHASLAATMRYVHDRRELASVVDAVPTLTSPRHMKAV